MPVAGGGENPVRRKERAVINPRQPELPALERDAALRLDRSLAPAHPAMVTPGAVTMMAPPPTVVMMPAGTRRDHGAWRRPGLGGRADRHAASQGQDDREHGELAGHVFPPKRFDPASRPFPEPRHNGQNRAAPTRGAFPRSDASRPGPRLLPRQALVDRNLGLRQRHGPHLRPLQGQGGPRQIWNIQSGRRPELEGGRQIAGGLSPPGAEAGDLDAEPGLDQPQGRGVVEHPAADMAPPREGRDDRARDAKAEAAIGWPPTNSPGVPGSGVGGATWSNRPSFSS